MRTDPSGLRSRSVPTVRHAVKARTGPFGPTVRAERPSVEPDPAALHSRDGRPIGHAGPGMDRLLQAGGVAAGRLRRARPDRDPRPGRDGLRRGDGSAADHRPLRDDRAAVRVCAARSVTDPRPRAGFGPAADHRRGHPATGCRRRGAGGDAGRPPRGHRRDRRARGRDRTPRLPDRPPVRAGPDRLPERHRPHRHRQPAAEAVRVQHGRRQRRRARRLIRRGRARRRDQPGRPRHRPRMSGHHPRPAPMGAEGPGHPHRRCRLDGVDRGPGPRRALGCRGRRTAPGGAAAADPAAARGPRHPRGRARRARIALVAATDTSVITRTFSIRRGEETDQNRELIALGAANLATGSSRGCRSARARRGRPSPRLPARRPR